MRFHAINYVLLTFDRTLSRFPSIVANRCNAHIIERLAEMHDLLTGAVAIINDTFCTQVRAQFIQEASFSLQLTILFQIILNITMEFLYSLVRAFSLYRQIFGEAISPLLVTTFGAWTLHHLMHIMAILLVAEGVTEEV